MKQLLTRKVVENASYLRDKIRSVFLFVFLCLLGAQLSAQSITFDNAPPYGTGNTGVSNGGYVFNFTTNRPITLDYFRLVSSAATYDVTIWYNTTKVNGQPVIANMNPAGGWNSLGTTSHTGLGNNSIATIPLNMSLNMNPGDTFAFFIHQSAGSIYPTTNVNTPVYSDGTVSIIADANSAFARNASTWYTPRQFNGGVIYTLRQIVPNNAGITSLVSPVLFCQGSQPISVVVGNYGNNLINNVDIHWELNGVAQPVVNYTTPIDTLGSVGGNTASVVLGNHTFTGGPVQLKVYTSNPNGVADTVNGNDTLYATLIPSLSGTYTIDQSSPASATNFTSFTNFATALNTYGVCGPVVANVVATSGLYNERVSFGNIPGSSAVNTIRVNGNGANVEYATTTGDRNLLTLSGTKYLRIDNVNFKTSTTTNFAWGALVTQGAEFDSITNCTFDLSAVSSTASANSNGIVFSNSLTSPTGAGVNGTNCYIANNHLIGPDAVAGLYYGIAIASGGSNNNIIFNNEIENYYNSGIYLNAGQNTLIEGNRIHNSNKTGGLSTNYGIYTVSSDISGTRIVNNKIYRPAGSGSSTSTYGGLYLLGDGTAGSPVIVANNLVYDINQGGASYGIYLSAALYNKVYHNTISFNQAYSGTGVVYGIYATGTNTDTDIKNNIVSITEGSGGVKYGFYYSAATSVNDAQRNNFYVNSTQAGTQNYGYYTTVYNTQAAFQTAYPTLELGSLIVNPLFSNPSTEDYTPTEPSLFLNGVNVLSDVPVDINGLPRTATPTPGAFQRGASGVDNAGVNGLVELSAAFCSGNQNVNVIISNNGTAALNSVTVEWEINGVAQTPFTYTGSIDIIGSTSGNVDTVTIGQYNFTTSTNLKIWTSNPNGNLDVNNGDDTLSIVVQPATFTASISNDTVCAGDDIIVSLGSNGSIQNLGLQWELSTDSISFGLIAGADSIAYEALNLTNDSWYRASITTNGLTCYSDTAIIRVMNPQLTGVTGGTHCGPGTVTLSATGTGHGGFSWYANATGGSPIGANASFTTPILTATDTFYVAANSGSGGSLSVGPLTPASLGAGGYSNLYTYKTFFTVNTSGLVIQSVDIFAQNAGTSGVIEILSEPSLVVVASVPFTSTVASTLSSGETILLNVSLPLGNYSMKFAAGSSGSYYRNTTGATFPYSSALLDITGQSFSGYPAYHYFFYNWKLKAGCESPRQMAIATITPPPAVTTIVSQATICKGSSTNLNVTSVNPGYTYEWLPGNLQGAAQTVSPDTTTSYILRGEDQTTGPSAGCVVLDTVLVTVDSIPLAQLISSMDTICSGEQVTIERLYHLDPGGFSGTHTGDYSNPFYHLFGGVKSQYVLLASDIFALGGTAGMAISDLTMHFTNVVANASFAGFSMSIGHTTQANSSTIITTGLQNVYNSSAYIPVLGDNTFNFSQNFVWDGVSNVVIQLCWSNNNSGTNANTPTIRYINTAYVSTGYYRGDNLTVSTICGGATTTGTLSRMPWMRFSSAMSTSTTKIWTPGNVSGDVLVVSPLNSGSNSINVVYTYTETGTNGCSASTPYSIHVNPQPTASILSGSTVICSNDNTGFFIDASGSTNANSYLWLTDNSTAPSYQVTGAGTYILEVENTEGCRDWDTIVITSVTPVTPVISINYQGSQAVLDAGAGYSSYLWNTLATTQTIVVTNSGQYSVTVVDTNGCEVSSAPVNLSVSVKEMDNVNLNLFPNPNKGTFTLSIGNYQDQDLRIDMYDLSGRLVYNQLVKEVQQEMQFSFDVSTLSDGMYMLKLSSGNSSKTLRFTVVK